MSLPQILILSILTLVLSSCGGNPDAPKSAPVIGTAYVGPMTLSLRKDLAPGTPVVGTVKHGEALDIIQVRRRFVRVRTKSGVEGWTDQRQLMTEEQIESLDDLKELAKEV